MPPTNTLSKNYRRDQRSGEWASAQTFAKQCAILGRELTANQAADAGLCGHPRPEIHALPSDTEAFAREAIGLLGVKDQLVLEMYHGPNGYLCHTFQEVGWVLGVSKERIRQRLARAHRYIRRKIAVGRLDAPR